jgi:hypothetical protein
MKKPLHCLLTAIAIFISIFNVSAQSDSLLDLGRIKIRKDFTQNITIKGSDLQQMPFSNLADAIAPWLHGGFTNQTTTVYVVDGVIMNDVNSYNIHDIEEITLVQNALTRISGVLKHQQMVLVKTKRNTEGNGLLIAGGSAVVKTDTRTYDTESEKNFYHQYHISAWKNAEKFRFGLSAGFQRDVAPFIKGNDYEARTPIHLNRYRFNGWLDVSLGKRHNLEARFNLVPQSTGRDYRSAINPINGYNISSKRTLLNPSIKLTSRLTNDFTNEISLSYLSVRDRYSSVSSNGSPGNILEFVNRGLIRLNSFLVREHLSYHKDFGNWRIEPAVDFTFRSVKHYQEHGNATHLNGVPQNPVMSESTLKGKAFVLTPSFSVARRNSFYFTGGIATNLSDDTKPAGDGIFPFASLTIDLLRLSNADNPSGLKIFGSYARTANFVDYEYASDAFTGQQEQIPGFSSLNGVYVTYLTFGAWPDSRKTNSIQAGALFSTRDNLLEISYNYDRRTYVDMVTRTIVTPPNNVTIIETLVDFSFNSHRLGVNARIVNRNSFQWNMGLNATTYTNKPKDNINPYPDYETINNNGNTLWTGGFTNRVQVKNFSFGLDVIYLLNEVRQVGFAMREKFDNWRINNIYAGYKLNLKNSPLEIYLCSSNPIQSKNSFFLNNRQYYGAGFKLQL